MKVEEEASDGLFWVLVRLKKKKGFLHKMKKRERRWGVLGLLRMMAGFLSRVLGFW